MGYTVVHFELPFYENELNNPYVQFQWKSNSFLYEVFLRVHEGKTDHYNHTLLSPVVFSPLPCLTGVCVHCATIRKKIMPPSLKWLSIIVSKI